MKEIPLTQGKVAIVDDADFEYFNQWKWQASYDGWNWYARRNEGNKKVYMHRVIANAPDDIRVDHANGNGLDNRRSNIRPCTPSENSRNSKKRKDNTSGFKGVGWHIWRGKYEASIRVDGRRIHLGYFDTAEEGSRAYNEAAKRYYGEFAKLNVE